LAAYADAGVGVIAVAQGTGFIREVAGAATRTLGLFFLAGLLLGGGLVYLQARAASAPLEAAAREVERRGWASLEPIPYRGPDDELARIVHRFNQLLAELLAELERGELETARESARHLLRLAEDLFALARGDLARTLEPHLLDLREIAEAVAREFPGVGLRLPDSPATWWRMPRGPPAPRRWRWRWGRTKGAPGSGSRTPAPGFPRSSSPTSSSATGRARAAGGG